MNESQTHEDSFDEKIEKMVSLTVAAARGIVPPGQVSLPLAQIAGSDLAPPEARRLARSLLRILNGERDPIALVADLSPEFAEIVWDALAQIDAPSIEPGDTGRTAYTFEALIEKVAEACSGEVMLWQRLWDLTEELANESFTPDIRALGSVLRRILAGERQKHILADLSPRHRWAVEQLLDWLRDQAVEPGE